MAEILKPECRFVDTGNAPEYFVEGIGLQELLEGGNVRTYVCSQRGNLLIPQYSSVASITKLVVMARRTLHTCADFHNTLTWIETDGGLPH